MKTFAKSLGEGKWLVYVTDDNYETYTTVLHRDEPPTEREMEEMFDKKKGNFYEA